MTSKLSPPEALIYAMITTAAVDRKIVTSELGRIGSIVRELPAFEGYIDDWLVGGAQECGKILAKPDGLERVLTLIRSSLPENLRETAYVLAAEVAATDLSVRPEEIRFLELLASKLELSKLTCSALERGARARHQKL